MDLLNNKKIMITAGPTREEIDPVRFLSNHSSGKMGFALATAAANQGAEVILISGPVELPTPVGIQRIDIVSALEMYEQVMMQIKHCDMFIAVAAVCDYRPAHFLQQKIQKSADTMTLELIRNPDILATVAALPHPPFTVGFAAQTHEIIPYATEKLRRKKLDMIIANQVGISKGKGETCLAFNSDQNSVTALWFEQDIVQQKKFPLLLKTELAERLWRLMREIYDTKNST